MSTNGSVGETPTAKAAGLALGRWGFGLMFLFFGVGKLLALRQFVNVYLLPQFAKTWLPQWLLIPYGYVLPFVEVALGVCLLLGLVRQATLITAGLLLLSLTFGQVLLQQPPVVFQNLGYVFFIAALLYFGEHDRWILSSLRPKREGPPGPFRAPPAS